MEELIKMLPEELVKLSDFITLKEYISKDFPSIDELMKRKNGYIYFGNLYVLDDYDLWFKNNNRYIKKENFNNELKGQIAYSGEVIGRVSKVYSFNDFSKFNKGDILVTPMTVPNFVKIMKDASAIVTDEGGVTCHAAIVSREFKIPCIVGCKNATTILSDGDLIKVNANIGQIEIISKSE